MLAFKIKNNVVPDYLSSLFPRTYENKHYNLRNHNDFVNLPRRTVIFERSCVQTAIQLWNSLPVSLTNMQSLGMFKVILYSYLILKKIKKMNERITDS